MQRWPPCNCLAYLGACAVCADSPYCASCAVCTACPASAACADHAAARPTRHNILLGKLALRGECGKDGVHGVSGVRGLCGIIAWGAPSQGHPRDRAHRRARPQESLNLPICRRRALEATPLRRSWLNGVVRICRESERVHGGENASTPGRPKTNLFEFDFETLIPLDPKREVFRS